jgi:hypothetical protein
VRVEARVSNALEDDLPDTNAAVANVTLEAVEAFGPRVASDRLITSGYLASDRPRLPGWKRVERRELEGWAADLHERIGAHPSQTRHTSA